MKTKLPKNFALVLIPEESMVQEIEQLREQEIGKRLVDGFPPHVTVKSRFWPIEDFTYDELLPILENYPISQFGLELGEVVRFRETWVVEVEPNEELLRHHQVLTKLLEDKISTYRFEAREGASYRPHLTLWRESKKLKKTYFQGRKFTVQKLSLYEMDPVMDQKRFAREIWYKNI